MITQREAFEAHAQARFLLLDRWATEPHEYHVRATNEAWIAWQAAQAAMPVAEPTGWVSVNDRLPPNWEEVMVWPNPSDYCMTATFNPRDGWAYAVLETGHGVAEYVCKVTHWMPLPAAPEAATAIGAKP